MKVLVTGADGFTGRHLVALARAADHTTFGLQSDLRNHSALVEELDVLQPEAVVHLGAISFVGHADASAFYDVNVIGTVNLLSALAGLAIRPKCVLLASSANVYGNCERSPIDEDMPPKPVNHYAMSKLAMEYMAQTYRDKLPLLFVRPFNYTGRGQTDSFVIPKLVSHFTRRATSIELGALTVEREFNDVRFVCEAYLQLLQKGRVGEVYNVCTGNPIALNSVIRLLENITGHTMEVNVNSAFIRANEIRRLCGNPAKLVHAIGELSQPSLSDTLNWMLDQAPVENP